jgi:acetyltransferase-like isoleucine patch superfamily enzyme
VNERPLVQELADVGESSYRRYLRMFVGARSFGAFLRYELLTLLLGPLPGALGYALRKSCYRWLLNRMGRGTVIGCRVMLRAPGRITIGEQVMIDDQVVLDAKGESSAIVLGNNLLIARNTILSCNDSSIRTGNLLSIGASCIISSRSHISIGSNVQIGAGSQLMAGTHSADDPEMPSLLQPRVSKGITVEDNVWIGNGTIILDGVTVGRNSIVGAGSVVSKDVPAYTVVLGNPARVIQKRK